MVWKPWQRPDSVPFPSTWAIYEGIKPLPGGKKPRFKIQDVTDELIEPTIEFMVKHFLPDEPFSKFLGLANDEVAIEEMSGIWRIALLKYRVGLIALLDNAEDFEDKTLPRIAGCNILFPIFPESDDDDDEMTSSKLRSLLNLINTLKHDADSFSKFNVSVILYALGLCVNNAYRGQGLGEQILRARLPLGKAVGIPLTITIFTWPLSQQLARKAGYEFLGEMNPEDYVEDGKVVFKGVASRSIQLLGLRCI